MEPRGAAPGGSATPQRVGWGIPDAAVAFVLSLVAAAVVQTPFFSHGKLPKHLEVAATLAAIAAQGAATVLYLAFAARRGRGSLRADFGLRLSARDGLWFVVGFGVAALSGVLIAPIVDAGHLHSSSQEVVRTFQRAHGLDTTFFVIAVLTIAPIGEELLFRGALLRALVRRTSPAVAIWVAALAFALVHVVLDPGAGFTVPALLLLGLLSGYEAWRTGDLSRSILLHAGFNLLAVLQIVT
jgi:CAAX protease family protein